MNCPNCKTWNPDDKNICWRCQAALPKPVEKKKKGAAPFFLGLPIWSWVVFAIMLILLFAAQCLGPTLLNR